jgi:hypothetical protein
MVLYLPDIINIPSRDENPKELVVHTEHRDGLRFFAVLILMGLNVTLYHPMTLTRSKEDLLHVFQFGSVR